MAIVTFIIVAIGMGLIIIGCVISIIDWNRRHQPKREGGVVTEPTSSLEGLAKIAEALKDYPLGMQLIFVGIVVLIVAGVFGGIAQL